MTAQIVAHGINGFTCVVSQDRIDEMVRRAFRIACTKVEIKQDGQSNRTVFYQDALVDMVKQSKFAGMLMANNRN